MKVSGSSISLKPRVIVMSLAMLTMLGLFLLNLGKGPVQMPTTASLSKDALRVLKPIVEKLDSYTEEELAQELKAVSVDENPTPEEITTGELTVEQEAIVPTIEGHDTPVEKFYNWDFPQFGLVYLPKTVDAPEVKAVLDLHDVKSDSRYRASEEKTYEAWGNVIERSPAENDTRFYFAKAGKKGWGVFADAYISEGEFIDAYTGIRTFDSSVTKYQWNYQSRPDDTYIGVDSLNEGNMMRFVNDDKLGRWNCKMVAIPYKNRWHTLYVATKDIAPGEELFISYGSNYWKHRDFF
ncbi:MAG: hypothetical protein SGCHY_000118 [Lobulomycetales sp.]